MCRRGGGRQGGPGEAPEGGGPLLGRAGALRDAWTSNGTEHLDSASLGESPPNTSTSTTTPGQQHGQQQPTPKSAAARAWRPAGDGQARSKGYVDAVPEDWLEGGGQGMESAQVAHRLSMVYVVLGGTGVAVLVYMLRRLPRRGGRGNGGMGSGMNLLKSPTKPVAHSV